MVTQTLGPGYRVRYAAKTMNESEFYSRCKSLLGDESDRVWDYASLAGFLQNFREDREPLRSLMSEIPRGLSVFDRIVEVFDSSKGYSENGRTDLYCVVRQPGKCAESELISDARTLLENFRGMAESIGEAELVSELSPTPEIRVEHCDAPVQGPNDCDSLGEFIYDVQCDWHGSLPRFTEHATWMREAFYYLDCDYYLANYVNWPWYMDGSSLADPFSPHFNLWRYGAEMRCIARDEIVLYLPTDAA